MKRGPTGTFEAFSTEEGRCRAFIPRPLPPTPKLELSSALQNKLARADLALGRLDGLTGALPSASLILYSYVRKEAVMSSGIEGTQSSLADLMLYEAKGTPGVPVDDVEEVSCYVAALIHGERLLTGGLPICTRMFNEIHRRLMSYGRGGGKASGELRRVQNWVGGKTPREAVFVPPPPNRLSDCLKDMATYINADPAPHSPLVKAALSHLQFETIHPYYDGNGRLGRLLITLIFLQEKVLREPVLFLSLYFKEHRETYYELLQKVRRDGDWEQWIEFFATAVEVTATQAHHLAIKLIETRESDQKRLLQRFRAASSVMRVHNCFCERPVLSISEACRVTKLVPHTVGKAFLALVDAKIIREVTGKKRDRIYAYTAYVELLGS